MNLSLCFVHGSQLGRVVCRTRRGEHAHEQYLEAAAPFASPDVPGKPYYLPFELDRVDG